MRLKSPTVNDILAWRERIAIKYREQLREGMKWDENSTFEIAEDATSSGDLAFYYVAAVLDQSGSVELERLIDVTKPSPKEFEARFDEASRRGFGGRFPHLLLGADLWLPFRDYLMIEEPDWEGKLGRYGSVFHLVEEVTNVRASIAMVHPSYAKVLVQESTEQVLVAAW